MKFNFTCLEVDNGQPIVYAYYNDIVVNIKKKKK